MAYFGGKKRINHRRARDKLIVPYDLFRSIFTLSRKSDQRLYNNIYRFYVYEIMRSQKKKTTDLRYIVLYSSSSYF